MSADSKYIAAAHLLEMVIDGDDIDAEIALMCVRNDLIDLINADQKYDRSIEFYEQNGLTPRELAEAKSKVLIAKSERALALSRLIGEKYRIAQPGDGDE